ncbi:phage tail tip lysozyme, partial [Methylobacterium sp. E-025]|uniref:phage tail tip lysozyme n=1 Tax=Methylobacterium sp. E-025 TaxID=2836561 RepID=UPI001FB9744E
LNTIVESGDRAGIRGNAEAMDKDLSGRLTDATKRRDVLNADPVKNADEIKSLEKEIRTLTDAIKRSKDGAGPSGVSAIPMSYSGPLGNAVSLIQKASFGGGAGMGGGSPGFGGPIPTLGVGNGGGSGGGGGGTARIIPPPLGGSAPVLSGSGGGNTGNYTGNDGRRAARGRLSAQGRDNIASWMNMLQRPVSEGGLGMPKGKAQATIAMMQGESGLNLDPSIHGDSGHAHGTAQWSDARGNPRFPLLRKYAASQGKDWRDRGVPQEYLRMQMLGLPGAVSHHKAYRAMMGAPSDEATLYAGISKFENPQHHDLAYQIRVPFLNRLRQDGESAASAIASGGGAASGLDGQVGVDLGNGTIRMPNGRIRSKTYGTGRGPSSDTASSGDRMGDQMMRRLYGDEAPVAKSLPQEHRMTIDLNGFPPGTRARTSMGDLFKETTVSKSRQVEAI